MEKQLSRTQIYNGKIIKVAKDEVVLDDGTKTMREVVTHNGGAAIALKDGDYYYMVKQYRYAQQKEMLEFPAGKIELNEDPLETVKREVQEETGFSAKDIKPLGFIIPTCAYDTEKIYLYHGVKDKEVGQHLDENERLNVYKYTFKDLREMVRNGEIDDAKTVALMYRIEIEGLNDWL